MPTERVRLPGGEEVNVVSTDPGIQERIDQYQKHQEAVTMGQQLVSIAVVMAGTILVSVALGCGIAWWVGLSVFGVVLLAVGVAIQPRRKA